MKHCRMCNIDKEESEFYRNRRVCKKCKYEQCKIWRSHNRKKASQISINSRNRHLEKARERDRISHKKWRLEHPDVAKERYCKWRDNNKEKVKEYMRDWNIKHSGIRRIYNDNRKAKILGNGGTYTEKEWITLCDKYNNKCLCCGESKKLTVDHIIPVSKGGTNNIDNIQPLCMECNMKKNAKTIDYRI